MEQRETLFDVKPQLTTAMKLAASFAITYYGLLLIYEVFTLVYSRYFVDSYYFNQGETEEGLKELWTQIVQLILSTVLVFSLIQVFRKKVYGKALFVGFSFLLIGFQLYKTGLVPIVKYALEVLLILIIAPIRVKKKIKQKKEEKEKKEEVETVEEEEVKTDKVNEDEKSKEKDEQSESNGDDIPTEETVETEQ